MEFLWNTAAFIITLGLLVTIHEYGHFWVARKLGIKVLTFSIGFGKPLYQRRGKDGVLYVIASIPLGGYVKMLDERESKEPLAEEDQGKAFNQKSVWTRMAVVIAGPVANFLLAILLYWWMFVMGITGILPELGHIPENSIAEQAGLKTGDRILQVDGQAIETMHDLNKAIAIRLGETSQMTLEVQASSSSVTKLVKLDLKNWQVDDEKPEILHSLGFFHPLERLSAEVGKVVSGGPADRAGIRAGDIIREIDGESVDSWQQMQPKVESRPNKEVLFKVERDGELIPISVVIGSADENQPTKGRIGINSSLTDVSKYRVLQKADILEAFGLAIDETANMIALSMKMFKKLITGEISTKSLSGPISIAEGAGNSASYGLNYLIRFMAMISVNLGFINLLPVPMLDGGHLLYFVVEAIKGKPLSEKMQEFGLQIGMMLVFTLMAVAIYNDIWRFF